MKTIERSKERFALFIGRQVGGNPKIVFTQVQTIIPIATIDTLFVALLLDCTSQSVSSL